MEDDGHPGTDAARKQQIDTGRVRAGSAPTRRAAHLKLVGLIHPAAEPAIGPSWSRAETALAVRS